MKEFLRRHKKLVLAGAIILIFTVLLCIPATLRALIGVFGYAAYLYLVVAYALLVMRCKNKKLPLTKGRLALYWASAILLIMTLHVGLCGKALTESGAGGYIGGSYETFTVGGVLFTLLSLPVVLPCKFIASVIIYFVATAVCGFFLIAPLVFETPAAKKKKVTKAPTENKSADLSPARPEPSADSQEFTVPVNAEPKPTEAKQALPDEPAKIDVNSPEYARMLLFGKSYVETHPAAKQARSSTPEPVKTPDKPTPKFFAEPQKSGLFDKEEKSHDDNPYRIIDGVDALLVPPDVTTYTDSYLNRKTAAHNKLFNNSIEDDYAGRKARLSEKTTADEIKETMKVNPYIPSETIFEATPKKAEEPMPAPEPEPLVKEPEKAAEEVFAPAVEALPSEPETTNEDKKEFFIDDNGEIADVLPTIKDSPFVNALRAEKSLDAPTNVFSSTPAEPVAKKEIAPPPAPEKVPEPEAVTPTKPPEEEPPTDPNIIRLDHLKAPYSPPPLSLLIDHVEPNFSPYVENFAELKEVFEVRLKNYGIDAKLIDTVKGPTITLCVLELDEKCSITAVMKRELDIERLLKIPEGKKINILTRIPGSSYFGIEIPNTVVGKVALKEILASREWNNAKGKLLLGMGKTNSGEIVIEDIVNMPHGLIAGSSGSGKSVCINIIIASLLYRYSPDDLKLVLIDLKYVEMANYAGLPHMLFKDPLSDVTEVINGLNWLSAESDRRYLAFRDLRCRDLNEYNAKVDPDKRLPRIVIIIDEASELMTHPTAKKVLEGILSKLARVARAAGIHMLFATQTPSKEVITSEIQNNMTTKIAFAVSDYVMSQVIFKSPEAAKLLGKGDMMIKKPASMQRAQCALITTPEIDAIVEYIKEHNKVEFDDAAIERILHGSKEDIPATAPVETKTSSAPLLEKKSHEDDAGFMELAKEALRIFVTSGKVSATYIQRRFAKGYNTIANVMDYLQEKGYITEPVNNKRSLLITKEDFYQLYPDCRPDDEE